MYPDNNFNSAEGLFDFLERIYLAVNTINFSMLLNQFLLFYRLLPPRRRPLSGAPKS